MWYEWYPLVCSSVHIDMRPKANVTSILIFSFPELESTFSVQVLPMRELPETYTNRFNILSSYHHTYCLCLQELLR